MTDTKSKDLVAAAIALAPQIKAAKDEIQSQSTLPGPLAAAMADALTAADPTSHLQGRHHFAAYF